MSKIEQPLPFLISRRYTIDQCRVNFDKLFIYGDNREHIGLGGTAIIREQVNSCGISTKKRPSNDLDAFYTDKEYEENCKIIDEEIEIIKNYAKEKEYISYVFPKTGVGAGLALLPSKAPKTFCYLTLKLLEEFGFNNLEFLAPREN